MSLVGAIIEYMEQGRFLCALVLQEESKRLRLVNQNGREMNLPHSRLLHQSQERSSGLVVRDEQIRLLKEKSELRQEMAARIDLAEIWQLASEETTEGFSPDFLAGLAFGEEAGDDQVAAFLRSIFVDRLYFKYRDGLISAHSPEQVEQLKARQEKERRSEELLAHGAEALSRLWRGDDPGPWPERAHCLELLADYYLFDSEASEYELARTLLKKAGLTGPHDPYLLLIRAGFWQEHENVALLRHGIPTDFSVTVLHSIETAEPDAENLLAPGSGRRDLRHLPLLTIDGESTRDYDDALHLEERDGNFLVGIHISDVAHYVGPGDPAYREAKRRMTSIYFPEGQIPMLPPELSEGLCSLVAGRIRAAISVLVLLSPQGEVLDSEIVPSLVMVRRRLSYPEVDRLVGEDRELATLFRLSEALKKRRVAAGALLLPVPDVNIGFDSAGKVEVSLSPVDTPGRSLVAEFMVLANSLSARFVADREAPGLFRAQAEPHQRQISGLEKDLFAVLRQRKQLKPGELLVHPKPHSGVGVTEYTTVTSPIRRFLDLVMQHQIKALLRGRGPLFSAAELGGLTGEINAVLVRVNQVRRFRHQYWLLKYLESRVGSRVQALVINRGPKRVSLVLLACLFETDLAPAQAGGVKAGDILSVRLAKVDPLEGLLRIEL